MNTREIAEENRLSHWAEIMRERKDSGQSIRAYCRQSGFHENVFYYWQRKLGEAAVVKLADQDEVGGNTPEGWALCTAQTAALSVPSDVDAVSAQLTVETRGLRITAGSKYPVEQLAKFLRELSGC